MIGRATLTGVVITSSDRGMTLSGTLTARVYVNSSGKAGGAGNDTGLFAKLDNMNTHRHSTIQIPGSDNFVAGDEIYVVLESSSFSSSVAPKIRCAIEWQDIKTP
jgi:hypothetical protein